MDEDYFMFQFKIFYWHGFPYKPEVSRLYWSRAFSMHVYGLNKQQQRYFYRNDLNKRFHSSEVKPLYRIHRVIVIKKFDDLPPCKKKKVVSISHQNASYRYRIHE